LLLPVVFKILAKIIHIAKNLSKIKTIFNFHNTRPRENYLYYRSGAFFLGKTVTLDRPTPARWDRHMAAQVLELKQKILQGRDLFGPCCFQQLIIIDALIISI